MVTLFSLNLKRARLCVFFSLNEPATGFITHASSCCFISHIVSMLTHVLSSIFPSHEKDDPVIVIIFSFCFHGNTFFLLLPRKHDSLYFPLESKKPDFAFTLYNDDRLCLHICHLVSMVTHSFYLFTGS